MNIALIGPRGAGKTKVSMQISRRLKWPVLSLDALISYEENGKSIPSIIEENNGDWHHFRDVEYNVLEKAAKMDDVILDCGGGIIVDVDEAGNEIFSHRKVDILKERSVVFFLHPPLESVIRKITGDAKRPSLSAQKSAEKIFNDRLPYYRKAAHHEIYVIKSERKKAARKILKILSKNNCYQ